MASDLVASTSALSINDNAASSSSAAADSSSNTVDDLDLEVAHPLQHEWTMFFNPPQKASATGEWHSNVKAVTDFSTVEDFWRLFNALKAPSALTIGSNYHMFKKGIQPEWEDEVNRRGGKWTVLIPRRPGAIAESGKQADDAWLHTLLALIGEQFGADSDEICGVVIGPRSKETRLALWTRNGDDSDTVKRIGAHFKANIRHESMITYQLHDEAIRKQTSHRNEAVYKL